MIIFSALTSTSSESSEASENSSSSSYSQLLLQAGYEKGFRSDFTKGLLEERGFGVDLLKDLKSVVRYSVVRALLSEGLSRQSEWSLRYKDKILSARASTSGIDEKSWVANLSANLLSRRPFKK